MARASQPRPSMATESATRGTTASTATTPSGPSYNQVAATGGNGTPLGPRSTAATGGDGRPRVRPGPPLAAAAGGQRPATPHRGQQGVAGPRPPPPTRHHHDIRPPAPVTNYRFSLPVNNIGQSPGLNPYSSEMERKAQETARELQRDGVLDKNIDLSFGMF